MTIFELEEAICEFVVQNTSELRFRSNEQSEETVAPHVYSGYVPRDEVGAILAGDISTYPAIIISAQAGNQAALDGYDEVTAAIIIGCYDGNLDQQGYKRLRESGPAAEGPFLRSEHHPRTFPRLPANHLAAEPARRCRRDQCLPLLFRRNDGGLRTARQRKPVQLHRGRWRYNSGPL